MQHKLCLWKISKYLWPDSAPVARQPVIVCHASITVEIEVSAAS